MTDEQLLNALPILDPEFRARLRQLLDDTETLAKAYPAVGRYLMPTETVGTIRVVSAPSAFDAPPISLG